MDQYMEGLLKVCNNRLDQVAPAHESQLLHLQGFLKASCLAQSLLNYINLQLNKLCKKQK